MTETVIRKRIEILADTPLVKRVTRAIELVEISGWTVLPVQSGSGRDGPWRDERVTGSDKSLILTVAALDKAARLSEELAPILSSHGLLLTMWDVEVVRGERF
ncbi:P-II family nitrogen regulator [Pontixanthobacter sp.]|uniref:P-II family nitrogen regulator n=1 Tax=Pontixanthobacter sp. TaxID=2792078 RepID=UPI003C79DF0C